MRSWRPESIHGFHYDDQVEADLRAGGRRQREYTDQRDHKHRVTLYWNDRQDAPAVATLDLNLAVRVLAEDGEGAR